MEEGLFLGNVRRKWIPQEKNENGWPESRFGETKVFLGHVNNQEPCNKDITMMTVEPRKMRTAKINLIWDG